MSALTKKETLSAGISQPRLLLHLEGGALLLAAITLYADRGFSWWAFAIFLLAPDISIAAYAVNTRIGGTVYNLAHITVIPLAIGLLSAAAGNEPGIQIALIWLAHIGMDHAFGYGFKYPENFKDTHFSRI